MQPGPLSKEGVFWIATRKASPDAKWWQVIFSVSSKNFMLLAMPASSSTKST
jgi:hypothetical protein